MKAAVVVGMLLGAGALALPVSGFAQGAAAAVVQGRSDHARLDAGELEMRAKIVELDAQSRMAVLRTPKGRILMVDVPADVKGLDQVRVGDDLVFRYAAGAVAKLEKAPRAGSIREHTETTERVSAPEGALPGTAGRRTVDILATITALNAKARTVTLRGAARTATLNVPQDVDMKGLKVGDDVRATIVEAAVLGVERPAAR